MKFACEHCHTKYTIEDERVRGKLLKIRCKGCQNLITVRDPASVATPHSAAAAPATALAAAPVPALGSGAGPSAGDDWYVSFDGQQEGPFSLEQAKARVRDESKSDKEAHAWRPSYAAWKPVAEVSELAPSLASPSTAPTPPVPVVPASPAIPVPPIAPPMSLASRAAAAASKPLAAGPASPAATSTGASSIGGPSLSAPSSPPAPVVPAPPVTSVAGPSPAPPVAAAALAPQVPATQAPASPHPEQPEPLVPPTAPKPNGASNGAAKAPAADPFAELLGAVDAAPATVDAAQAQANQPQIVIVERPVGRGLVYALVACMAIIILLGGALGYTWLWWIPAQRSVVAMPSTPTTEPAQPHYEDRPVGLVDTAPKPTAPIDVGQLGGAPQSAAKAARATKGHDHTPHGATEAPPAQLSNAQSELAKMYGDSELSGSAALPQLSDSQKSKQQVSDAQITSVISRNKKSIQVCYDRVLKHDDSVRNLRVDVELKIGSSGMVTGVKIPDARIASSELGTCLVGTIKRWHFPEQDQGYQTAFPLLLQAQN